MTTLPRLAYSSLFAALLGTTAIHAAEDRFAAIAPRMQTFVDQKEVSGVVTLLATKDEVLHLAAVGQSNVTTGRTMQTDDIFWIASMTKPIVAVAVAILADEGKLDYADAVEDFLPEFANQWLVSERTRETRALVRPERPITIHDLLTHTSGLGEYRVTHPHWTLAERSLVVAREPLRFAPGSRWGYSTAGIDVLGRVIEVVSGQPFAEFMQQRLFDPLEMSNTTFWLTPEQEERFAENYRKNAQTGELEPVTIDYFYGTERTDRGRPPLGGAGLFSTAEDVAKFYQMMFNGGARDGHRILKLETVTLLTTNRTGDLQTRPGMSWCYGFCVVNDPSQFEANDIYAAGSWGHGGAHGTQSWVETGRGVIFVIMLQRSRMGNPDNSPMRRGFQEEAAAALDR